MKQKTFLALMLISLLVTACTSAGKATATPAAIPTILADSTIIAEGHVEPVRFAEIAFNASGVVSEVLVNESQPVKKGQPLIHLGNESDTNYAAAQLELVSAQQAFEDLLNSSDTDLAQAVIALKDAREAYDKADKYLRHLQNSKKIPQVETRLYLVQTWKGYRYDYKTKYFKGPVPRDWIIEAENDLALKKAEWEAAQRTYERMKDGPDTDQLELLQARLNAAKARVAAFAVTAPFDGVVADMQEKAGGSINAGEIAVTVADFSDWLVKTTDLTEMDVVKLTEDQPVLVTLDAIPDVNLRGEILAIGQTYSEKQGDVVYEIIILLTDTHPAIRWGMTASVAFGNED